MIGTMEVLKNADVFRRFDTTQQRDRLSVSQRDRKRLATLMYNVPTPQHCTAVSVMASIVVPHVLNALYS